MTVNMAINERITAIRTALKALGAGRKGDKVSVENNRDVRSKVFVNNKYFGMFDFSRCTFVD